MKNKAKRKMFRKRAKKDRKIYRYDGYAAAAAILLVSGVILLVCAACNDRMAQWYSTHVYFFLVSFLGRVSALFPFSMAEILLYILLALLFISTVHMIGRMLTGGKKGVLFYRWFSRVFLAAGILLFLYVTCCGINYHRGSFSDEAGIDIREYSTEELEEVCLWLTKEVNIRADKVPRDTEGRLQLEAEEKKSTALRAAEKESVKAMKNLSGTFSCLRGYYPRPKGLLVSEILSYQGLTGMYIPFTIEAGYNADMLAYNIPFTLCHELSHLRGFMQEQEANFIAFLACTESQDMVFQYSGYLSGWLYCMNTLYEVSPQKWQEVRGELAEDAEADLAANNIFWNTYDGTVAEVANKVNDTYLKVNGQAEGVYSYDRMVDLIVAYFYERL
ncbi:DUF3810 domain-containing protein [Mediterraneibacter massiliensis]|uniref:DUF3810 domain-containing protein n=1 Tax=Mediterraneibacter massiliensis TaxID=1720300 RepID=UPI001FA79776|nr:DUF3810 domain-containing protein [Mediterraneibacter massiliensis]